MRVNITEFKLGNIIDTCSIWNMLSSISLYSIVKDTACYFSCSQFVIYECLHKKRNSISEKDNELKKRLIDERAHGKFTDYQITIEDLQSIDIMRNRKKVSMGELSSIVFAKKTNQAFLTDDQGARKISEEYIGLQNTQTLPQLVGWLTYNNIINDLMFQNIISEHNSFGRLLEKHFKEMFLAGLEKRLQRKEEG